MYTQRIGVSSKATALVNFFQTESRDVDGDAMSWPRSPFRSTKPDLLELHVNLFACTTSSDLHQLGYQVQAMKNQEAFCNASSLGTWSRQVLFVWTLGGLASFFSFYPYRSKKTA